MESEERKETARTGGANGELAAASGGASDDYVIRVLDSPERIPADAWNALLALQGDASPFMRHEYLSAMHDSGSATTRTGWQPRFLTLWRGDVLQAACPLFHKAHSYGEYVFDWAWANAYRQHGLDYYPKGLVAVPFTPVPGPRLLARDANARAALVQALLEHAGSEQLSSMHLLFLSDADAQACADAGLMLRHTVQFHWTSTGLGTFDGFLATLQQEKRKKIRQERRKVADAGVRFRHAQGKDISAADWNFFYRCYERTYLEHGNPPYLSRDFFVRMAETMPEHWLLFIAERDGQPMAASLIGIDCEQGVAFGRYWGALERVDCLHFEACYYQPLSWCIEHGFRRFEGGAQGEHKMARALMPVRTTSAHWLAHPAFAEAVERFLEHEDQEIHGYLEHLSSRSPLKPGVGL
ncbi:GNAT family N-acetyltransferase [Hydrogenophaga sp. RWCD_12]|uniref:GNAT family N-acetyltransferase n=1 Tax=Hydrogenophaga sp. RWCD_12 TaxID=3391190 RepID=UPI0039847C42